MIIAVLSSGNYKSASDWIKSIRNIVSENIQQRTLIDARGHQLIVVWKLEHVLGINFRDLIKAPDYVTLEDEVRVRMRQHGK